MLSCCPTSRLPLIGASGAVAGVIAAYLILHPRVRVWVLAFRFIPLRIAAAWVLGVWVVTQFVMIATGTVRPGGVVGACGRHGCRRRSGPVPAEAWRSALRSRSSDKRLVSSRLHLSRNSRCFQGTAEASGPQLMLPSYCPKCLMGCPIDTQFRRPYVRISQLRSVASRCHSRVNHVTKRSWALTAVQHDPGEDRSCFTWSL